MSTIFFLSDSPYDNLDLIARSHDVITIDLNQLQGVPKKSIVFTYNYKYVKDLATRGFKVIFNPRNSLSPSVISDLAYLEYDKNVQYVGSALVKEYLTTYLKPWSSKWLAKFVWYENDEQIGLILDKKLTITDEYEANIFTQSQIIPKTYAEYINTLNSNLKYALITHPSVTIEESLDGLLTEIDGKSVVTNGRSYTISTGLRGSLTLVHHSEAEPFKSNSHNIIVAPSQIASELLVHTKLQKLDLKLFMLPQSISQHTHTKLGADFNRKLSVASQNDFNCGKYHDPVLDSYDLKGNSEDHIKPYLALVDEIISYYD